jgi:hypothetical protein
MLDQGRIRFSMAAVLDKTENMQVELKGTTSQTVSQCCGRVALLFVSGRILYHL